MTDITKEPLYTRILRASGILLLLTVAATGLFTRRTIKLTPKEKARLSIRLNHGPVGPSIQTVEKTGWDGIRPPVRVLYTDGTYQELSFEELKSIMKP